MVKYENRAAYLNAVGVPLSIEAAPLYEPQAGEVLIENHATAIQPLDAKKHNAGYGGGGSGMSFPTILGTNLAGIVVQIGQSVTRLQIGDRVVADTPVYVNGDKRSGAWQKYVVAKETTIAKIGDASYAQAVAIGFPLQTAVAALQEYLGMPKEETNSDETALIWGAGGAVGTCAVQYAKSVGCTVIATASSRDFERQENLGVDVVYDYRDPEVVAHLRSHRPFRYLFSASGDAASHKAFAQLLQPDGGKFASVLPVQVEIPTNIESIYTAFSMTTQTDGHEAFRNWWYESYLPRVISSRSIEPVALVERIGGLSALQEASKAVADGKVKGKVIINASEK